MPPPPREGESGAYPINSDTESDSKWVHKRGRPLAGSLTFLALSMAWFSAFLYVCVQNGVTSTSFPGKDLPSRLFSLGSVYGMQRPMIEVAWRTTCAGIFGMLALGVCDLLYARKTKARWFGLHTIANMWISILCLPECWFMVSDPITALTTRSCDHWPTALVFSVHVYHVAFFCNLYFIDWLHHILMVVVGAPLLITGEMGPLMNFNNFFMCSLPGVELHQTCNTVRTQPANPRLQPAVLRAQSATPRVQVRPARRPRLRDALRGQALVDVAATREASQPGDQRRGRRVQAPPP